MVEESKWEKEKHLVVVVVVVVLVAIVDPVAVVVMMVDRSRRAKTTVSCRDHNDGYDGYYDTAHEKRNGGHHYHRPPHLPLCGHSYLNDETFGSTVVFVVALMRRMHCALCHVVVVLLMMMMMMMQSHFPISSLAWS